MRINQYRPKGKGRGLLTQEEAKEIVQRAMSRPSVIKLMKSIKED